ncbi:MAG: glycosyltransferase, partial [Candidatus Sericytochromatia bacterium]
MRVSIIINNYNYARFLAEAIDSALAQTHPDVEVVVVDAGSTDESRAIIAGYGERIVPVLKENGGQASAFNVGFAASSGAWVIFLDADDRLAPTAAAEVARRDRPGLAKVQYRLQMIDAAGDKMPSLVPPVPHRMPQGDVRPAILVRGGYTCPPTTGNAFRREVLAKILPMPAETWRLAADSYTFLLAPFHGEVASIDEALGDYRFHGGNHWLHDRLDLRAVARQVSYDLKKEALICEA